jgi:hypothetical protein
MILFRFDNGLVTQAWEVWDEATMRRQLQDTDAQGEVKLTTR